MLLLNVIWAIKKQIAEISQILHYILSKIIIK